MLVLTEPISNGRSASRAARTRPGRLHLDGITQRGAGAVRLEVVDIAADQARPRQRRGDEPLLRTAIGHRQTAGRAVLVDRGPGDHRAHPVAVPLGVAEPLEHQDAASLTAHIAVGGRVESLAVAHGRQHPGAGGRDEGDRTGAGR